MNCSLYEDIWNVRIHFDNNDLLERKLSSSDVTYLNMVALMETQGFSIDDSLMFYMETPGEQGLELVDSNVKLQLIKRQNEESLVLNLLFRACPPAVSVPQKGFVQKQNLDITEYSEPVVFDLADPPVYAVDQQGVAYEGQSSSYIAAVGPAVLTQESRSVLNPKLKEVVEEEQDGYDGSYASSSEGQYDSDTKRYYIGDLRPNYNEEMNDAEDMEMEEGNR